MNQVMERAVSGYRLCLGGGTKKLPPLHSTSVHYGPRLSTEPKCSPLSTHRGILDADLVAHWDGLVAVNARVQPDR